DDRVLRTLQPVELLLPREVANHPRDRIDRREAPRRLRGRHGLESPDPLAAREPELGHQRMCHRFSNAFFMAAAPCSIIVRISPASSSGKRSAVQTSRLRVSPSAKTWAAELRWERRPPLADQTSLRAVSSRSMVSSRTTI